MVIDKMYSQGPGFLEVNEEVYQRYARLAEDSPDSDPEKKLNLVQMAALSATRFHSGRFADGKIENLALRIGQKLAADPQVQAIYSHSGQRRQRRVLHVATKLAHIGGHTRMLRIWAERDHDSQHSVVVTDQGKSEVPSWLHRAVEGTGGQVIGLEPERSLIDRALTLRALSRQADVVFLHIHSFDVIPVVAFAVANVPPCVFIDIADHEFWLGSTIADLNVNLRAEGARFAARRRFPKQSSLLPIPLEVLPAAGDRTSARRELGIPEEQVMVLTVGRAEKYRPCLPYDFVATANRILDRNPGAHLYLVGETREGIEPYLRVQPHARLHFMGPKEDPSRFRAAADLYVESFPFGSQTALLESALMGLPAIPAYDRAFPLLGTNDDAINHLLPNLTSESEYIVATSRLIQDAAYRTHLGSQFQDCLQRDHIGARWDEHLAALYGQIDRLTHAPAPIPETESRADAEDIALSIWHAAADGENWTIEAPSRKLGQQRHAAFVNRDLGNYGFAFRSAAVAFTTAPICRRSWRLLALAALGSSGRGWIERGKRALASGKARPLSPAGHA